MTTTSCELTWLLYLLQDLHIHHLQLTLFFCDNQTTLHIADNPVFHERTKYIEIDCHLAREKIQADLLRTSYVSPTLQLVDLFTKPLGKE